MNSRIQSIGVIGAGTMGHGIAQVAALAGFEVVLVDISADALARGRAGIEKSLGKLVDKGRLTADERTGALAPGRRTARSRSSQPRTRRRGGVQKLEIKREVFREIDASARRRRFWLRTRARSRSPSRRSHRGRHR